MGMSVKVPGGWMGTRSVGVRAGPVSLSTRHSGPLNGLLTLICLPIYALTVAVTALAALLWIGGWMLKAVVWVATWVFKAVKGAWWLIVTPFRLAGRWVVNRFRRPQRWAAPDPMARVG